MDKFIRFPFCAITDPRVSKTDRCVLLSICSFLNNVTNECWPSRKKIAERAGIKSLPVLDRSKSDLQKYGYIKIKKRKRSGSKEQESNVYTVFFSNSTTLDAKPQLKKITSSDLNPSLLAPDVKYPRKKIVYDAIW